MYMPSFIKHLTKYEVTNQSKSIVPTVKRTIANSSYIFMTTVGQSDNKVKLFINMIIELTALLKTFQRQNIAFNVRKIPKNMVKHFSKSKKNAQILLKNQLSARECWKCKTVLQNRKSYKKALRVIGTGSRI